MDKFPVREVMTREPVTVPREASIAEAAQRMREADVGGLVVMDHDHAVGVVTERDIVQKVVALERPSEGTVVSDVMSAPIITTDASADAADAARLMAQHRVRRLPVLNGDKVVGMLTDRDILVISSALFEIARGVSEMNPHNALAEVEEEIGQAATCEGCSRLADGLRLRGGELLCEDCIEGTS